MGKRGTQKKVRDLRRVADQKRWELHASRSGSGIRRASASRGGATSVAAAVRERGRGVAARLAECWYGLPAPVRRPGNIALGAVLVALLLLLVLLFFVRRVPGYYRDPAGISDEQLIQWGEGFVGKANDFLNSVANGRRFSVTIEEDEINGYLAGFFRPEVRKGLSAKLSEDFQLDLPEELSGLMVHLVPGQVVLAARYEGSRLRPVLSLAGRIEVTETGGVAFRPEGMKAGLLPIPVGWAPHVDRLAGRQGRLPGGRVRLERVTVREGEIEIAGHYESRGEDGRGRR